MSELTAECVRSLLHYEPDTGLLFWKERLVSMFKDGKQSAQHNCAAWNGKCAGRQAATSIGNHGYPQLGIFGTQCLAHRIIWLWMSGSLPRYEIDHVDMCKTNNKWENLREATRSQNEANKSARSALGIKGVWFDHNRGLFQARVTHRGKTRHIGRFQSLALAKENVERVASELHGEFWRAG